MSEAVLFGRELQWYEGPGTPDEGIWLWAIEHMGHPAFYLRALLPGDFAPGRSPAARHVLHLDGARDAATPVCGTCDKTPSVDELEPVERSTGDRGFLDAFRSGRAKWPRPTDPATCWECSDRRVRIAAQVTVDGRAVGMCAGCARLWSEGERS